jgi:hypothetical protein
MRQEDDLPSWRDFQIWVMEGWFLVDQRRECYGLVFSGDDPEELKELDYI